MAGTTIPSTTTNSAVIQQNFINESGRIGEGLFRYAYDVSPWARVIKRGLWPDGMGDSIRVLNYERALAGTTGKGTWSNHRAHGFSSVATGNSPPDISTSRGLPPASVVQVTQRLREYNLAWTAVESTRIDVRDAAFSFQFKEQMKTLYDCLLDAGMRVWSYRTREEYFRLCANKVVIGTPESGQLNSLADASVTGAVDFATLTGFSLANLNMTGAAPSGGFSTKHSVLTGGVLRDIYARLCRNGAGKNSGGMSDGAPVFPLLCSPETSDYLIREAGTRNDLRWGNSGELLKPLGVNRSLCGFSHVIDHEVPRFTLSLVSSTYDFAEVPPWTYQVGSVSTAISDATGTVGQNTTLTVASTVGLVQGSVVTITVSSASDEAFNGTWRVVSVPSSTTVIVDCPFTTDTPLTGTLITNTNGQAGWVENTSYHTAPYEMSFILHPEVMEALTRNATTSLGAGTNFDPTTRIGDFNWTNIRHEQYNPDGTFGYFRGILEFASKPMKTQFGWAIIHRRPDPTVLAAPSISVTSGLGLTA